MSGAPAVARAAGATVLERMLAVAAEGYPVFLGRLVSKPGGGHDKKPAMKGWQKRATRDPEAIRRMCAEYPNATLICVRTGETSGIDAVDVDPRSGGDVWERDNLDLLPTTRVHKTLSGGSHYIYRHASGVHNTAGAIAKGIDTRGTGGFIVWWPVCGGSVRVNAPVSEWHEDLRALAVRKSEPSPILAPLPSVVTTDEAQAILQDACIVMECAARGERYAVATKITWELAPLAIRGDLDPTEAEEAIVAAAEAAGGEDMNKVRVLWRGALEKRDKKPWIEPPPPEEDFGEGTDGSPLSGDREPEPVTDGHKRGSMLDRMLSPAQCEDGPRREYIIKGLAARQDLSVIFGHPGSGKSIITPHIAYALAQGRNVFGRRTRQGRVLYIAAEDFHGMCARITALRRKYGDAEDFRVVGCGNLNEQRERDDVKSAVTVFRPMLVVIDTVATGWAGMDENDNSDKGMGAVVAFGKALTALGPAVILVHHPAKNGDTPRGGYVLEGAADLSARLDVKDDSGIVQVYALKNRNGASMQNIIDFRFEVVGLGTDEDGDPITTVRCVELEAGETAKRSKKLAPAAAAALHELRALALDRKDGRVAESEWRAACVEGRRVSAMEDAASRAKAFTRAVTALTRSGIVGSSSGNVWVIEGASASLADLVSGSPEEDFA